MTPDPMPDALLTIALDPALAPPPDTAAEPEGFLVAADDGTRIHFHDWGGPVASAAGAAAGGGAAAGRGLGRSRGRAGAWDAAARVVLGARRRRLAVVARTVVADLRGHGLSDAPQDGYDLDTLAADVAVVAEGSGALDRGAVVLAGHGLGAIVAAGAAALLGARCAGLVLVDGGFERVEETTGLDVEEFLRGLDEPPEVLRSLDAFLADRQGFDPATWDEDQERAARDSVVETAAGHVLRAVRPHVLDAVVRSMFGYDPAVVVAAVAAPVSVLVALEAPAYEERVAELARCSEARVAAGKTPIDVDVVPRAGHNLMRYAPELVGAVILALATPPRR